MSAPEIQGQKFPDYTFAEFPKVLYAGGSLDGEARIVGDAEEEAAAVAEGFAAASNEPHSEGDLQIGDETAAATEGDETVAGAEPADAILPASGADA